MQNHRGVEKAGLAKIISRLIIIVLKKSKYQKKELLGFRLLLLIFFLKTFSLREIRNNVTRLTVL